MRVDETKSEYRVEPDADTRFDRDEKKHCRTVLRRLQYLEAKNVGGGDAYDEREEAALAWLLWSVEFLQDPSAPAPRRGERG